MKPDGIGQDHARAVRQRDRAQGRIERCEQHVGGENSCIRQPVEQRRLAGIGVADQRNNRIRHPLSALPMQMTCALDAFEFQLDTCDAFADQAAVGFDLRLARPAEKAETAALTLKVGPRPHQPAALVREMRQFDLKRAFTRTGAAPENLKNETGTVENFRVPRLLEIALLDRRQRAVHHHEIGMSGFDQAGDLVDFAFTDIGCGTDRRKHHYTAVCDVEIDRLSEPYSLLQACLRRAHRISVAMRSFARACAGPPLPRSKGRSQAHDRRSPHRWGEANLCRFCGAAPIRPCPRAALQRLRTSLSDVQA